jgi:hypothetical protein
MVWRACDHSIGKQRQEAGEFKPCLGYTATSCVKQTNIILLIGSSPLGTKRGGASIQHLIGSGGCTSAARGRSYVVLAV